MNILQLLEETPALQKIDNFFSIKEIISELSQNLANTLIRISNSLAGDEPIAASTIYYGRNINEGRNDVKAIISNSILEPPEELRETVINAKNKNVIIRRIVREKEGIKIKRKYKEDEKILFKDLVNKAVDVVINESYLQDLVKTNMANSYNNIMEAIRKEINDEGLYKTYGRLFATNVAAEVNEIMSILNFSFMKNVKPKNPKLEEGETYYVRHPKGANKFPDFDIYLGKDAVANKLRGIFNLNSNASIIRVDGKKSDRVVGKQTTPEMMKSDLGKEAFEEIARMQVGAEKEIEPAKVRAILESLNIEFGIPTVFVNLEAKKEKDRYKVFNQQDIQSGPWTVKRRTLGQVAFNLGEGENKEKIYGIEIGSDAYKKGEFKPKVVREEILKYV